MGISKDRYDFFIFHEDNELIQNINCPSNVLRINLGKDGIGSLIASALLRNRKNNTKFEKLRSLIPTVLQKNSHFLTEFKPGVSLLFYISVSVSLVTCLSLLCRLGIYFEIIFVNTLTGPTLTSELSLIPSLTLNSSDIFWGNLTQAILISELEEYDLISFTMRNDANRLFLRGQFTLHK
jgi:hypothetical protein